MKLKNPTQQYQKNRNNNCFVKIGNGVMMFNCTSSRLFGENERCDIEVFRDTSTIKIHFNDNGEYIIGKI